MSSIMDNMELLVVFLGNVLGGDYEVVLQDVKLGRIRAIVNGHVSGRSVDAPLTKYALNIIASDVWKEKDFQSNYIGITSSGHKLRSSTYFIKEDGDLIGMLCINADSKSYYDIIQAISKLGMLDESSIANNIITTNRDSASDEIYLSDNLIENFSQNVPQMVAEIILEVFPENKDFPVSRLKTAEKLEIIKRLNDYGFFKIKGGISELAKTFECSEATVYRYLTKI